ncbi:MmgE/PrpD family protein [Halomarina litorea]|uniref:MmgE/PrpD family protein n=1 Tax=Halomarina litorea TaxID=2961595 RepID=UPI0020C25335|nr:MmgE/PrpD family protein [Halomarina sp. BCD28]
MSDHSETNDVTDRAPDAELAAFVTDLAYDDLPDDLVRAAERAFVDTVGVTVPGAAEGAGRVAMETIEATGGDGPATLVGGGSASLADAAFANGTAGHALDFDDVTRGVWHPSVPIVAPILVLAEARGLSGEAAVTAYVAGYETQCYLADALLPAHYERGWHATATFGTFGAAAAGAALLELDEGEARHALNAAASLPAGLKANFGTMTKPMHAGHAARSGLTAALLAERGHTATPGAMGLDRGFIDLYSGNSDPAVGEMASLGEEWALRTDGIQVKKYPCCYFTHPAIYATEELVAENGVAPEDVESITVSASQGAADALHYPDPSTGLEGKFSMEYTVACAAARDRVGLAAFDDENVSDPEVQAVRERVTFEVDPDLGYNPYFTSVTLETRDGERYERTQEVPPGTPADPLSDAELREKFEMCLARAGRGDDAGAAYDRLDSLREQEDAGSVLSSLS